MYRRAKNKMTNKIYCPYCKRCLGECTSSDHEYTKNTVLKDKPEKPKDKQVIHNMKCYRCKKPIYVSMEFAN